MTELAGRVALVTGGGSGIGRALSLALAAEGCAVAVADIALDRAQEVAEQAAGRGVGAVALACDVADRAAVAAMKAEAVAAVGPPTLVFANAGVTSFDPLEAMAPQEIDWILQTNLMGVMHCVEAFLPDLLEAGAGHIVATSSAGALTPGRLPHQLPYGASKLALVALMLNLEADYGGRGVHGTVLLPGGVPSRILEGPTLRPARFGGPGQAIELEPGSGPKTAFRPPEEVAEMTLRAVRLNRPVVITDETRREGFERLYVEPVRQAFDELDAVLAETQRGEDR
jgi:NAD(P)-dependent dehydrogenase (short-subunit alcohol dehydrogenase family)